MTTADTVTVEVNGRDVNLGDLLSRLERDVERFERTSTSRMRQAGSSAQSARSGFLALQQAVAQNEVATAKAAAAAGDYTRAADGYRGAITRLESVLAAQNSTTTQTLAVERQLITLRGQAARAAEQEAAALKGLQTANGGGLTQQLAQQKSAVEGLTGAFGGLKSVLGTVGLAIGAKEFLDFGINAGRSALELRAVEGGLKQIAGDTQTYNTIMEAARKQQVLFGGSLADNLSELSSFAVKARTTGADLNELIRTAQRLATLDPEQGIKGSKIALAEALSGDPVSLARRFEIPKAALKGLKDESVDAAGKLKIINDYLDAAGISANGAADSITKEAQAYNSLAAALEQVKIKGGGVLAELFAPAAEGLTGLLTIKDNLAQLEQQVFSLSQTYDVYTQKLAAANAQLSANGIQTIQGLSQAQFEYAQSLIATGTAQDEAIAKAQGLTGVFTAIEVAQGALAQSGNAAASEIVALGGAMLVAATGSAQAAATVNAAALMFAEGSISADQFRAVLEQVTAANQAQDVATAEAARKQQEWTTATEAATVASGTLDAAILKEINDKQANTQATNTLNAVQSALATLGPAVANGLITAGNGALILAQNYGIAINEGLRLLEIQAAIAKEEVRIKAVQIATDGKIAFGKDTQSSVRDEVQRGRQRQRAQQVDVLNTKYAEAQKAQADYTLALGTAAQKQGVLNDRLKAAEGRYGANSAEAIRARQALDSFVQSQDRATKAGGRGGGGGGTGRGRGGGGGAEKLSDQQKLNNGLLLDQQKFENKFEDEELKHRGKLLDIAQDYADKLLDIDREYYRKRDAQAQANELDKRSSALSVDEKLFESRLNESTTGGRGELERISAAYYQAFEEAQQAAQRGEVEKSERILDLAEKRADTELRYAEKIDQAREDKNQNAINGYEALREKARQLLDEEAKQLDARPDGLLAEREDAQTQAADRFGEQTQDENLRYEEAQGKIANSAERSAERRVTAAQLAGKAITEGELPAVEALNTSYETLAQNRQNLPPGVGIGDAPNPLQPPPAPTTPLPAVLAAPTSGPIPVTIDGLLDGLAAIKSAVESAASTIASAERDVERAVKGIKLSAPGGVQ